MLKISSNVDNLEGIDKILNKVNIINKFQSKDYYDFIKDKVKTTLNEVINERLGSLYNTNQEEFELYKKSNHFKDTKNGFILYNDATYEYTPEIKVGNKTTEPYKFSIALAFEYGTGLVGIEKPKEGHWEYNVHGYEKGWVYPKGNGGFAFTRGYEGMEIYRFTRIRVNKMLSIWNKEYIEKENKNV